MPDWIMYTVGVISHIWTILTILMVVAFLTDPRVKYGLAKIKIHFGAYAGPIGVIAFWSWFFTG